MTDERFKVWMTFWQFFLGTVVLGIVSTVISWQIQTREIEIKEQEASAKFLEQALQEDVGVRRRLAQYFSTVTRSSALRERWLAYAQVIEDEYKATLAQKQELELAASKTEDTQAREWLMGRVAQLDQALSPQSSMAPVSPRVYVHIVREDQRSKAEAVADALRTSAVIVPGVDLVKSGPGNSELRYFRRVEQAEAEGIASTISALWPGVTARYVAGYENSTGIRPRHFELWLSASP